MVITSMSVSGYKRIYVHTVHSGRFECSVSLCCLCGSGSVHDNYNTPGSLLCFCSLRRCVYVLTGTVTMSVPTGLRHISPTEITAKWSMKLITGGKSWLFSLAENHPAIFSTRAALHLTLLVWTGWISIRRMLQFYPDFYPTDGLLIVSTGSYWLQDDKSDKTHLNVCDQM